MRNIVKSDKVPNGLIIMKDFGKVDYCDSYQIIKNTNDTADSITASLLRPQKWVDILMKIKNSVVSLYDLENDHWQDGFIKALLAEYKKGHYLKKQ